jgi:hypothetical protein
VPKIEELTLELTKPKNAENFELCASHAAAASEGHLLAGLGVRPHKFAPADANVARPHAASVGGRVVCACLRRYYERATLKLRLKWYDSAIEDFAIAVKLFNRKDFDATEKYRQQGVKVRQRARAHLRLVRFIQRTRRRSLRCIDLYRMSLRYRRITGWKRPRWHTSCTTRSEMHITK